MAEQSLDQQRAWDAWEKCACVKQCKDYATLAKGLPALVMNSGLIQVMAYLEEKGTTASQHRMISRHIRSWLHRQFELPEEFSPFMEKLVQSDPKTFQEITTEVFAWLRWVRQMASARSSERDG